MGKGITVNEGREVRGNEAREDLEGYNKEEFVLHMGTPSQGSNSWTQSGGLHEAQAAREERSMILAAELCGPKCDHGRLERRRLRLAHGLGNSLWVGKEEGPEGECTVGSGGL